MQQSLIRKKNKKKTKKIVEWKNDFEKNKSPTFSSNPKTLQELEEGFRQARFYFHLGVQSIAKNSRSALDFIGLAQKTMLFAWDKFLKEAATLNSSLYSSSIAEQACQLLAISAAKKGDAL